MYSDLVVILVTETINELIKNDPFYPGLQISSRKITKIDHFGGKFFS